MPLSFLNWTRSVRLWLTFGVSPIRLPQSLLRRGCDPNPTRPFRGAHIVARLCIVSQTVRDMSPNQARVALVTTGWSRHRGDPPQEDQARRS